MEDYSPKYSEGSEIDPLDYASENLRRTINKLEDQLKACRFKMTVRIRELSDFSQEEKRLQNLIYELKSSVDKLEGV